MLLRLVHPPKAASPMLVTLSGIVMLVRLLQLEKAPTPMLVTPSGIVILVRNSHSKKASFPMLVTGFPSMVPGMISVPDAPVSQSVMVIVSPLASKVRSLTSAAWSGFNDGVYTVGW